MNKLRFVQHCCPDNAWHHSSREIAVPGRFPHPCGRRRLYTTYSLKEIADFGKEGEILLSYKLAGQPVTLTYDKGRFVCADVCNDGTTGYDVTETIMSLKDIPMKIADTDIINVRGTVVMPWPAYHRLVCQKKHQSCRKIPEPGQMVRDLVLGTDSKACAQAKAEFIVYDMGGLSEYQKKSELLETLRNQGFKVIKYQYLKQLTIEQIWVLQKSLSPFETSYPVTGLVFESEQLLVNCFDPDARKIMALAWPYDLRSNAYADAQYLIHGEAVEDEL